MAFAEIAPDEEVLPLSPGEFPVSYAGPAGTAPKKKERYAEIGPDEEVLPLQPPSLLERGVSAVKAIPAAVAPIIDKVSSSVSKQTGKPALPPPRPRPAFQVDPNINQRAEDERAYYRGFFAPGQVRAQAQQMAEAEKFRAMLQQLEEPEYAEPLTHKFTRP